MHKTSSLVALETTSCTVAAAKLMFYSVVQAMTSFMEGMVSLVLRTDCNYMEKMAMMRCGLPIMAILKCSEAKVMICFSEQYPSLVSRQDGEISIET